MFSAGEIAKSIHAVAQCIQTIRAGNSSAEEEAAAMVPPKAGNSAVSGISSIILSQQLPSASNVSVVSSSMDCFGAPESALLPPEGRPADRDTRGNSRTVRRNDDSSETKPAAMSSPSRKKLRLNDHEVEEPPRTAGTTPSFEQAAIVAALEHLYGKGAAAAVQKHVDAAASAGTLAESQFRQEKMSPSAALSPKKFQHISRALLGTSGSHGVRGAREHGKHDSAAAMGSAMGPRPSLPTTTSWGARPSATAAERRSLPMASPSAKKAPYLDAKPSAVPPSASPAREDDEEEEDDDEEEEDRGADFAYNDSKYYSSKSPLVLQPSAYDVLLGRGKSNKNHPGNKRFQDCIQANRERYFNALTNVAKRDITMEILQFIRQKGRFLRRGAHGWVDVPTPDIQQKVAHALQYRRRCVIKEKTGVARPRPDAAVAADFPKKIIGGGVVSMPPGGVANNATLDPNLLSLALSSNIANRLQAARNNELANAENAIAKHNQQMRDMEYYQSHLGQLLRSTGSKPAERKEAEDQQVEDYFQQLQQQQFATSAVQQYLLQNARPSLPHRLSESTHPPRPPARDVPPPPPDNLDSSGLHSLADVISRIYSQEQKDITLARGCHGA